MSTARRRGTRPCTYQVPTEHRDGVRVLGRPCCCGAMGGNQPGPGASQEGRCAGRLGHRLSMSPVGWHCADTANAGGARGLLLQHNRAAPGQPCSAPTALCTALSCCAQGKLPFPGLAGSALAQLPRPWHVPTSWCWGCTFIRAEPPSGDAPGSAGAAGLGGGQGGTRQGPGGQLGSAGDLCPAERGWIGLLGSSLHCFTDTVVKHWTGFLERWSISQAWRSSRGYLDNALNNRLSGLVSLEVVRHLDEMIVGGLFQLKFYCIVLILFYSILFYSILFYSILFNSICSPPQMTGDGHRPEALRNGQAGTPGTAACSTGQ